jgi:hypothetical protein
LAGLFQPQVSVNLTWGFYVKIQANRLYFILFSLFLFLSGKAEPGSAGEQPVRNNLIDWNGLGLGIPALLFW